MPNKFELAENKFIESIGRMSDAFGLNSFVAKLYALLYLTNKPLSLDEITDKLGVSKGNVSVNIRILESWGAVRKIWIKGSRKDYYEANLDIKKIFANKLANSIQKRISEISNMLEEFNEIISLSQEGLTEEEKSITKIYKERLKKIEDLKNLGSNALSIAEKLF